MENAPIAVVIYFHVSIEQRDGLEFNHIAICFRGSNSHHGFGCDGA
jgi:hypothetical protein